MSKRHIVAVDWDGTLVTKAWPGMGHWLPDAVWAMQEFLRQGCRVMVFSVRLSPYWQNGTLRKPEEVEESIREVREMLDEAGLYQVGIWTKPGKPPFDILIDDRAIWFPGTRRAWKATLQKALMRLGKEAPGYDDVDWENVPTPA